MENSYTEASSESQKEWYPTPAERGKANLAAIDREAIAKQREEAQVWAKANLRLSWEDETHMRGLASNINFKLANWWRPASETRYLKRALRAVGKDGSWFREAFGFPVNQYAEYNPTQPAWVAQCNILEMALEGA